MEIDFQNYQHNSGKYFYAVMLCFAVKGKPSRKKVNEIIKNPGRLDQ
jgi:hypothetical protein